MLPILTQKPKWVPSPNFGERKNGKAVNYIILHYTDTQTTEQALGLLLDPAREVSAHYVVEENGKIIQMVADEHRAWHAGVSQWHGETDMNSVSLGIEIVNPGHTYGHKPFPDAQIATVIELCRVKMAQFNITPENVLGHSDIAPGRKQDPGPLFPWEALAAQGVALWPRPQNL